MPPLNSLTRAIRVNPLLYLIAFLHLPLSTSSNCDPHRRFYGYSFIRVDLLEDSPAALPYPMAFRAMYASFRMQDSLRQRDNIDEWHERFCRQPRRADMESLIYRSSVYDLQQLRTAISSASIPLPPALEGNSFARYLRRHECRETVDYLIYAKRCEPFVTRGDPWSEPERNVQAMQNLIQEARNRFLQVESHYIRLRYAYQMVRLAHYAGLYREALQLYDYLLPKIDHDPSLIEYWILGHRAGALRALDRRPEAAYLYMLAFLHCPSRRSSALRSFQIRDQAEWEATLRLCRTDAERATLYAMRAYADDSRAVEDMEAIYAIDPLNPHLEPLLVKEMTELERDLLGLNFNPRKSQNLTLFKRPRRDAGETIIDLQEFVRRLADDNGRADRGLWKVAEGYLETIAGDFYGAERTFREAREIIDLPKVEAQLQAFELVLRICSLQEVDNEAEESLARLQRTRLFRSYPDFPRLLNDKLTALYSRTGYPGKAFITRYSIDLLRPNPRENIVGELLRLSEKDDPNRLETQLLRADDGRNFRPDLLDMEAVNYMQDNQMEAALASLEKMGSRHWERFGRTNPFVERLNDCVNCSLPDTLPMYTRGEIIERILELEYTARSEPELAAITYYRIGIALYNMTYFSHAWRAMDHFRSGASLRRRFRQPGRFGDSVFPYPGFPLGNREYFDCSRAKFYFERAKELSRNPELTARATFWEAKCARNMYFADPSLGLDEVYDLFDDLRENSGETDYYARIIRECKTFASYTASPGLRNAGFE